MDIWRSAWGIVEAELTSADPPAALAALNNAGIEVYYARQSGALSLCFSVRRSDWRRLRRLTQKRGERLRLCRRSGLYWVWKKLLKRPVLLVGIALIVALTWYLPTRIFFVEIQGNRDVPASLILEKAAQCGIEFGTERRGIRSEQIKNELLQAIPRLQWAGINTYGCRAVISVRERPEQEPDASADAVRSIVADRDGVIRQITVRNGNRVCQVGQAVKAGQVLISGYTDCGICIRASCADGEVLAETSRAVTAVMPANYRHKGEITRQETKYSLLIGKKQINFYKDSGISDTTCDKMYSVKYITLPGGFQLPFAIVTQTVTYYDTAPVLMDEQAGRERIVRFAQQRLMADMAGGQILHRLETVEQTPELFRFHGQYVCLEMIGKPRLEENLIDYG